MEEDRVRVLRVIEYIGRRSWVEETVAQSIQGTRKLPENGEIRAATIGDYPEILLKASVIDDQYNMVSDYQAKHGVNSASFSGEDD